MPKLSILMPVYNTRPEHLRQAMDSILAQTFTDFEFLIVNDCSTDPRVEEIIASYEDPRIAYTVNERNLGISGSRNRLLDMARGEYAAVMDHDDISLPTRLEKEAAFLDTHPDVGIVGSLAQKMDGSLLHVCPADDVGIKKMLMLHCNLSHSSCMFRLSVLRKHGIRYEELFSPAEDYALFARLIPVAKFAVLQEVLFQYRTWEGNTSHHKAKEMEAAACGIHAFMRRDNPGLWAMAQAHQIRIWRYRLLGLPVLSRKSTLRETTWLLFNFLPVWKKRESLPRICQKG